MKNSFTIIIILLLFTLQGFAQDRMYVTAESGLIVREKPTLQSDKIFHLRKNTMVLNPKKTGITLTITDKGKKIKGEWLKIYGFNNKSKYGYVFDGFLSIKKPKIWYSGKSAFYKTYDHYNLQEGTFKPESFSKAYLSEKLPVIKTIQKVFNPKEQPSFLNPENNKIILFSNHELKNLKPVAILNSLVQVQVDSTFYKYKYKDFTDNVWNRIIINNNSYYTDADIHDYSLTKELVRLNQKLIIVGQDTESGAYPEYFFLIFVNNENKIIHRTEILDFKSGYEFALEEDLLNLVWNEKNKLYEIILIGYKEKIIVKWDGIASKIIKTY